MSDDTSAAALSADASYDARRRRVLWSMPVGLYLLGAAAGEEANLMTTSLSMQVSVQPKRVAAAVESNARTLGLIRRSGAFALCLLPKSERALVRKFVKPASHDATRHELNGVAYLASEPSGSPVPRVALAYLDCAVEHDLDLDSHALLIGQVRNAVILAESLEASDVLSMADVRMSYGG